MGPVVARGEAVAGKREGRASGVGEGVGGVEEGVLRGSRDRDVGCRISAVIVAGWMFGVVVVDEDGWVS